MEKRILVPLDYSEVSQEVVQIADQWAQRKNASLFFLHVDSEYMDNATVNRESFLKQFEFYLDKYGIESKYQSFLRIGTPYVEIVQIANELEVDLIIMAAHSHTLLGRIFLGSNTDFVLHHCKCPVYVHKQETKSLDKTIIVPVDRTPINVPVIKLADSWAQQTGSKLIFIHTDPVPEYGGGQYAMESGFYHKGDEKVVAEEDRSEREKEIERLQRGFNEFVEPLGIVSEHSFVFEFGKPYLHIEELQKKTNAGLIMMAAHSHTLLDRLFMGSNTDYLVHHLNCPIYIYKNPEGFPE